MPIERRKTPRFTNAEAPLIRLKGRKVPWPRQCAALAAVAAVLAGCGDQGPPVGTIGHLTAYFGGASADEPRATVVGRDVLSAGGTAMDAAVAMYFAMSVTLPSAAGLGGGGVCVVYSKRDNKAETLEFLAKAPAQAVPEGRWAALAPGNVRGMFALHARYGRLRWEELVLPAERLARFGSPASRALAGAVSRAASRLRAAPDAKRVFAGAGEDALLAEGETFRRVALAATLARIRSVGPGDLYSGTLARRFVDGVRDTGGWLTAEDMRNVRPTWRGTVERSFDVHKVHFPDGVSGGRIAAAIWRGVQADGGFPEEEAGRLHRLVDAARTAYRAAGARPDIEYGSAGYVVMDRSGNAASCAFTMNESFGSGHTAGETDVLIARPAADTASAEAALVPVVMANHNRPQAFAAATAAGDSAAPVAAVSALIRATQAKAPLTEALAAFRAAPGEGPRAVLLERAAGTTLAGVMAAPGAQVFPVTALGRVNLMYCPDGVDRSPELCDVRTDPRGHGYAVNAEF